MENHVDRDCACIFCNCKCPECGGWNVEFYFDDFRLRNGDDRRNMLKIEPYDDEVRYVFQKPTLICFDCQNEYTGNFLERLTGLCQKMLQNYDNLENLAFIDITIEKNGRVSNQGFYLGN
jgi:hypothetical protein